MRKLDLFSNSTIPFFFINKTTGVVIFIIISMMSLVTRAALSSNKKVIEVLRLVEPQINILLRLLCVNLLFELFLAHFWAHLEHQ